MSGEFYHLDQRSGWRASILDHVEPAADAGTGRTTLGLRRRPGTGRALVDAGGSFGGLTMPTSLALDAEGRIYILDAPAQQIKRYDPCAERFDVLPCVGGAGTDPRRMQDPRGIAIAPCGDLYVADTGNRRVQVFALKDLVLRQIWSSPRPARLNQPWLPVAVAVAPDGRVLVCDYDNGLIHVFDRNGRWRTAYDGAGPGQPALQKPLHLAVDRAGRIYVIQDGQDFVVVLDVDGKFLRRVTKPAEIQGEFCPMALAVDERGTIYISDRIAQRVFAVCEGRADCGAWPPRPQASPARGVLAHCPSLAFSATGDLLVGDGKDRCVRFLEPAAGYDEEGVYITEALDSELYQCEWHRVELRMQAPFGTRLRVDTFTSESPRSAADLDALPESRWATMQMVQQEQGDWDCLILSAPGRYLWLRLVFMSDGTDTPRVERIRVHYPRQTPLQSLPAAYSEDALGRDFLNRYLSIVGRIQDGIGQTLDRLERIFDPLAAPASPDARHDFLGWLAGWLDLVLDRRLPASRKRALLKNAHRVYALRGTAAGLRLHLQLYFGAEPRILEHFKLRRWLFVDQARLGDSSVLYGQAIVRRLQLDGLARVGEFQLIDTGDPWRDPFHVYAHQFTVVQPMGGADDSAAAAARLALNRIVEVSKPAHTQAYVRASTPRFRLDGQAYLGLDTVIGRYPAGVTVTGEGQGEDGGSGRLGVDAVMGPSRDEATRPTMRLGRQARIGATTRLD
ncbi:MAG: hypothetical protein HZB53_06245 [Chloroflexi bacterium]|nr:hypothetical protein [Chloroflexota bacterium]